MDKNLSEMSNEELWQLFPIALKEYNSEWPKRYKKEKLLLVELVGTENIVRINHIGSTAVPGLLAKPTIDILLEIRDDTDLERIIRLLEESGYIYSPQPNNPAPHMMFMKGYTPEGFKGQVFHLHIRYSGDWNEIYFRDYLRTHPEEAIEYGKLKIHLKEEFEHNRDGYTHAKSEFIKRITEQARKQKRTV